MKGLFDSVSVDKRNRDESTHFVTVNAFFWVYIISGNGLDF